MIFSLCLFIDNKYLFSVCLRNDRLIETVNTFIIFPRCPATHIILQLATLQNYYLLIIFPIRKYCLLLTMSCSFLVNKAIKFFFLLEKTIRCLWADKCFYFNSSCKWHFFKLVKFVDKAESMYFSTHYYRNF